jgi:uncharacterized membrane-anchored protein YhcB (DUF1043 family)
MWAFLIFLTLSITLIIALERNYIHMKFLEEIKNQIKIDEKWEKYQNEIDELKKKVDSIAIKMGFRL